MGPQSCEVGTGDVECQPHNLSCLSKKHVKIG